MAIRLNQEEATLLIDMAKETVEKATLEFPASKGGIVFDVVGKRRADVFLVNIDRKGINAKGCSYQGRIKSNNVILMRLDVNPTAVHVNPSNGEKIYGTHLHVYTETYELSEAVPFNIEDKNLYETCFIFFKRFNIIEPPALTYQGNLFA